jgi:hypothetical protein
MLWGKRMQMQMQMRVRVPTREGASRIRVAEFH